MPAWHGSVISVSVVLPSHRPHVLHVLKSSDSTTNVVVVSKVQLGSPTCSVTVYWPASKGSAVVG